MLVALIPMRPMGAIGVQAISYPKIMVLAQIMLIMLFTLFAFIFFQAGLWGWAFIVTILGLILFWFTISSMVARSHRISLKGKILHTIAPFSGEIIGFDEILSIDCRFQMNVQHLTFFDPLLLLYTVGKFLLTVFYSNWVFSVQD